MGIVPLMLMFAGGTVLAQIPTITAVQNEASSTTLLAPGTLATILGSNLTTSATACTAAGGAAWTTSLCNNTQAMINNTPTPLFYVSATGVSFQIPFGLNTGPASVIVVTPAGQSASFTIQLSAFAPGISEVSGTPAIYHASFTLVSAASPAAVNEELLFYCVGLGPTNPFVAAGSLASANPLDVTVTTPIILIDGSVQVTKLAAQLAPDEVSAYQVNFIAPTLSPGSHTLVIQSGGISSQTATLYVAPLLFFQYEVSLGSGVYYELFPDNNPFGYYNYVANSIFYHYDMGYEAFVPGTNADIYLYDFTSKHWWYTSTALFPYLYDFTLSDWLYYFPDTKNPGHYTTNPRYFSNLTTGKIITM
jgi:uncharacterized protein (TIGR03437 family)